MDVLRRGLSELTALCEHMLATFEVEDLVLKETVCCIGGKVKH